MKRIAAFFITSLFISNSAITHAQPVMYLAENFDVACATGTGNAAGWIIHNPTAYNDPGGRWQCDATNGRPNASGTPTPGMKCTGIYNSTYNKDTAYLITPLLILSSYAPGHVYLYFDTKTDQVRGRDFSIIVAPGFDSLFQSPLDTDISLASNPIIGPDDASGRVTHEINIDQFEARGAFYIGFRYTSTIDSGSIWYLDNVNTTSARLSVTDVDKKILPLTTLGVSSSSQIVLSFGARVAGACQLAIYDMMGRAVHTENLSIQNGTETYTIGGLNLTPGMYFIKMGDGNAYGATKVIIQ